MECPKCGFGSNPAEAKRCLKCGYAIEMQPPPQQLQQPTVAPQVIFVQQPAAAVSPMGPPKSRVAAGVLGILLGAFGAHRFYLGYNGIGAAYLLVTLLGFCTFVLPILTAIAGLIDGILILAGVVKTDAWGRPLR